MRLLATASLLLVCMAWSGCASDSKQSSTTAPAQPKQSAAHLQSASQAAQAMSAHGFPVKYQEVQNLNTIPDAAPNLRSLASAEAEGVGFSIEVYDTTAHRAQETAAQKSFATNGKLFQAQCGTILLRIPSVPIDKQPTYESLAGDAQDSLNAAYNC